MKLNNFFKGVFYLIISQILIKFFGIIYTIYITNKTGFGDEGNAIYMSGYQIYALILTVSSIGVPNAISKLISEKESIKDYINEKQIIKISTLVFALIGFIGSVFLYIFADYIAIDILKISDSALSIMILSPAIFFVSISSVYRGYFYGIGKVEISALNQFIEQLIKCVCTIIFVEVVGNITSNNTMLMATAANFATVISTLISTILLISTYIKYARKRYKLSINNAFIKRERVFILIKNVLIICIPMTLTTLIGSFSKNIDSVTVVRILKNIVGEKDAIKLYGILVSKLDIFTSLPLAFNASIITVLIPEISKYNASFDKDVLIKKIKLSYIMTFCICIPYCFILYKDSFEILNLIFPNSNEGCELLKFSTINIVFAMLVQTSNGVLQGLGKEQIPLISSIIGIIFKFLFNIIFINISTINIMGAIIGNLSCNIVSFIILIGGILKIIKENIFDFRKIIEIFLISFGIIFVFNYLIFIENFLTKCLFYLIFYTFFVIFLKIFQKNEIFQTQ